MVVRQHLNEEDIHTYRHYYRRGNEITVNPSNWETLAQSIPDTYEKYSIKLLTIITDLWITIRGHSFAKEWTMKFKRKYKKGTRKSLQAKTDNK